MTFKLTYFTSLSVHVKSVRLLVWQKNSKSSSKVLLNTLWAYIEWTSVKVCSHNALTATWSHILEKTDSSSFILIKYILNVSRSRNRRLCARYHFTPRCRFFYSWKKLVALSTNLSYPRLPSLVDHTIDLETYSDYISMKLSFYGFNLAETSTQILNWLVQNLNSKSRKKSQFQGGWSGKLVSTWPWQLKAL